MEYSYATVETPVGTWTVQGDDEGIVRVHMPHERPLRPTGTCSVVVADAARQLAEYFEGERTRFTLPLTNVPATTFQRDVWRALQSVPYGQVATYADVAAMTGRPNAARAVGNANHANPWPVIVPCHRVVARHGIGGYGGGDDVKRFLLALEGVTYST